MIEYQLKRTASLNEFDFLGWSKNIWFTDVLTRTFFWLQLLSPGSIYVHFFSFYYSCCSLLWSLMERDKENKKIWVLLAKNGCFYYCIDDRVMAPIRTFRGSAENSTRIEKKGDVGRKKNLLAYFSGINSALIFFFDADWRVFFLSSVVL